MARDNYREVGYSPEYRPIGAWGYFGYNLLFALPVVGLILLIVFSLSDSNINRRNYARSFFCVLVVALVILLIAIILVFALGVSIDGGWANFISELKYELR